MEINIPTGGKWNWLKIILLADRPVRRRLNTTHISNPRRKHAALLARTCQVLHFKESSVGVQAKGKICMNM